MNTLIAGPIVTETHTPSTVESWMSSLLYGGIIVLGAVSLVLVYRGLFGNGLTRTQGFVAGIIAATGLVATVVGCATVVVHADRTVPETHYDALAAALEDTYDLEAIEFSDSKGTHVFSTGERVPYSEDLCEPVSTNSPEYTGITDGQQISFKVGVPDCRAETPDVQIVVTKTPGIPLTADDLRKRAESN